MIPVPTAIRTVRWMVRDTFRQSVATKLFWVMLGLTVLCTVFCLGIEVRGDADKPRHPAELPTYMPKSEGTKAVQDEGIRVVGGEVSLGFGLFKFEIGKNLALRVRPKHYRSGGRHSFLEGSQPRSAPAGVQVRRSRRRADRSRWRRSIPAAVPSRSDGAPAQPRPLQHCS